MATFQILYWQDIPTAVRSEDGPDEVKVELDSRFQVLVDQAAEERGLEGTDAYLEQWRWSEPQTREGTAEQVAEAVKRELEAGFAE